MPVDIVTLGQVLIDMRPAEAGRTMTEVSALRLAPGSAPANVAVAAARLGAAAAFIGKVGDDPLGHHLAEIMSKEHVDVRGLRFDPAACTAVNVPLPHDARSQHDPGTHILLQPEDLDRDLLQQCRALHLEALSLVREPGRSAAWEAVRVARRAGALISFDFNYQPALWRGASEAREQVMPILAMVDVIKTHQAELELMTGSRDLVKGSERLLAMGVTLCVLTLGSGGSYFRSAAGGDAIPGFIVPEVDTAGCGDAFMAGLLWRLLREEDWRDRLTLVDLRRTLRYANAVGALTAMVQGVIPALPAAEHVEQFLLDYRSPASPAS